MRGVHGASWSGIKMCAITSKYAVITHRPLRWRFFGFFALAFALRFLGLPCALRCRFAGALSSFLDRFLFFAKVRVF